MNSSENPNTEENQRSLLPPLPQKMTPEQIQQAIQEASDRLTDSRKQWMDKVLNQRIRHFTLVLEDLFDPHNISALIRTAEVYGLQDVHIIEEENAYRVNKSVLKGSFKWLNLFLYKKRQRCLETLRAKGYRIAVASTNTQNSILDLDLSQPIAFYMGAEFRGNHPDTLAAADVHFKLPQYGVTESMNVSVAGGVMMTYLDFFLQKTGRSNFAIQGDEKEALRLEWYRRQIEGTEIHSPLKRID